MGRKLGCGGGDRRVSYLSVQVSKLAIVLSKGNVLTCAAKGE